MPSKLRPNLVKLPKPKVDPEDCFIRTLVWVLNKARAGEIRGYAMVYAVEDAENIRWVESAAAFEDQDRHHVLGMMRRMEHNYMARSWAEDEI